MRLFNNRQSRGLQRVAMRPVTPPKVEVLTDANGMQYVPAPTGQENIVVENALTAMPAESSSKPTIINKSETIFGIKIVNSSADTAYDALFLDAKGNVSRDLSQTNNAAIDVSSTTHDYDSFLEELKTVNYQVKKIVFRTPTGDESVLDNKNKLYRYDNGPGAANVFKTIVPSSGISGDQYNLNVYEIIQSFKLGGDVAGIINMPQDTTLNIYIYFV